jgi:hypothetical protein
MKQERKAWKETDKKEKRERKDKETEIIKMVEKEIER